MLTTFKPPPICIQHKVGVFFDFYFVCDTLRLHGSQEQGEVLLPLLAISMPDQFRPRTLIVRLISTAQTGFFYTTQRLRQGPRLSTVKYDPKGMYADVLHRHAFP